MNSQLPLSTATLLLTLDLERDVRFALSGAASGVKHKLDAFGIGVLAFVAGNAGGVVRDLLIGAVPPAAISDWRYVAVSLVAGGVTFLWYPNIKRLQPIVLLLDAAGLGLFAVAGAQKAVAFGVNPFVSALLGMLTGIGGGVLRDLLVERDTRGDARRSIRVGRARGLCRRRRRASFSLASHCVHDRRRTPVFRHTPHRDSTRLESAASPTAASS